MEYKRLLASSHQLLPLVRRCLHRRAGSVLAVVLAALALWACKKSSGDKKERPEYRESSVLDLFPDSGLPPSWEETTCTFTYKPSGSEWNPGVDEKQVFLASIESGNWRLGVGKGGQIYSLRGPYGESVPPQRQASPWNDEVWQTVATSEALAGPIQEYQLNNPMNWADVYPMLYFAHQSGIYVEGEGVDGGRAPAPFYSPCLRQRWNPDTKTLELVNWMQQARSPCVWKSNLLIYTAYRDAGSGVIEANQVLHNFGDIDVDYLSTPWGGVRKSSLPRTIVSKDDGTWEEQKGAWGWHENPNRLLPSSGGWVAWVRDIGKGDSPALAKIFGPHEVGYFEKPKGPSIPGRIEGERKILWGTAGEGKERDYEVSEQVTKITLRPGDSVSLRWYLVTGTFDQVREETRKLSGIAGIRQIEFENDAVQPVWIKKGVINTTGEGKRWGAFAAFPAKGTVPVFLLKDRKTGRQLITADIYALAPTEPFKNVFPADHKLHALYENRVSYKQFDPQIGYENLLGFAFKEAPKNYKTVPITPPKGVDLHESARNLKMIPIQ